MAKKYFLIETPFQKRIVQNHGTGQRRAAGFIRGSPSFHLVLWDGEVLFYRREWFNRRSIRRNGRAALFQRINRMMPGESAPGGGKRSLLSVHQNDWIDDLAAEDASQDRVGGPAPFIVDMVCDHHSMATPA